MLAQLFTVSTDAYHHVRRLDLASFDDAPMHPMYLVYKPPQMLPTTTLNPASLETGKSKRHVRRDIARSASVDGFIRSDDLINPDRWLWFGIFMTAMGGIAIIYS